MHRALAYWAGLMLLSSGGLALAVQEPLPKPVTPPPVVPGQKPPGKLIPPPGSPEAAPAPAQPPRNADAEKPLLAGDDAAVQPFIDANTFLVVRVDASAMDLTKDRDWVFAAMKGAHDPAGTAAKPQDLADAEAGFDAALKTESDWVARFRAAGGRRLYFCASLSDVEDHGPFVVVPLEKGANADALIALFPKRAFDPKNPNDPNAESAVKMGQAVVFGERAILDRLKQMPASKPRQDLTDAMAAAGGAPIRAAIVASDSLRTKLEALLPTLPDAMGGGSTQPISHGLAWASIALNVPPAASLKIIGKARDADAAKQLQSIVQKAAAAATDHAREAPFDIKELTAAMKPTIHGDRVRISVDSQSLQKIVGQCLLPSILSARQTALRVQSMHVERQLALGCIMYADEHNQQWPDSLDQITKYVGGKDAYAKLIVNPRSPGLALGFIYKKPANPSHLADQTIVIYEAAPPGTTPERLCAAFADGHCEYLTQAELKQGLSQTKGL